MIMAAVIYYQNYNYEYYYYIQSTWLSVFNTARYAKWELQI